MLRIKAYTSFKYKTIITYYTDGIIEFTPDVTEMTEVEKMLLQNRTMHIMLSFVDGNIKKTIPPELVIEVREV